jgi:2-polyprenyl-3-methyl-5-hydroxy-6-metoxy-1,4-benzoquinol methylase
MTFVETCPCCGGDDVPISKIITVNDKPYLFSSICQDCGVDFLNPRMTDERTRDYYQGEYRDKVRQGFSDTDLRRQRDRALIHASTIKKLGISGSSVLEIGSSAGYLLYTLHASGFDDCQGIEPDERYRAIEPACNYPMFDDISVVPPQAFDLVVMSHSLEHINTPLDYLRNLIDRYTHNGTYFLIEVPNIDANPNYWIHHPINFNAHSLNGLFERLGCRQVASFTHGMSIIDPRSYLVGVYQNECVDKGSTIL